MPVIPTPYKIYTQGSKQLREGAKSISDIWIIHEDYANTTFALLVQTYPLLEGWTVSLILY